MSLFKKAERKQAKLKLAMTGPAGAGKTFSSLLLASGIGKRIAVIDTENGSASLYADKFEFDTLEIEPPYTVQKYIQAIKAAEAEGYDVVVIDSISHAWAGDGGLLAKKEAMDVRGGNSFSNWGSITKEQEQFKSALLNADIHMIVTMRSKQDYVLEQTEKGKSAPRKVGLAPIQRDGMEYEFTAVFDVAMDHNVQVSKDRTGLFDGQIFTITEKTGETIMQWLNGAKPAEPKTPTPQAPPAQAPQVAKFPTQGQNKTAPQPARGISDAQIKRMYAIAGGAGWPNDEVKRHIFDNFGVTESKLMNRQQYDWICNHMMANPWVDPSEEPEAMDYDKASGDSQ